MLIRVYEGGKINVTDDIREMKHSKVYIYYGEITVNSDYNTECRLYNFSTGKITVKVVFLMVQIFECIIMDILKSILILFIMA